MSKLIIAIVIAFASATASASCRTIIINGQVITCCTYGSVTNCF
jgi:hypothetical protein